MKRINIIEKEEQKIISNQLIPLDVRNKDFEILINLYQEASNQILEQLLDMKYILKHKYNYDIINSITSRIKSSKSIINKMKKKNLSLNYKELIDNINDIAGIRITCPLKSDIEIIKKMIKEIPDICILKEKDYIRKPKSSGYSAYHLIVETPINVENKIVFIKIEIQIRTMAMDFWSTIEHKMRYKTKNRISIWDSKKLSLYAKIINMLDNKLVHLYNKQQAINKF